MCKYKHICEPELYFQKAQTDFSLRLNCLWMRPALLLHIRITLETPCLCHQFRGHAKNGWRRAGCLSNSWRRAGWRLWWIIDSGQHNRTDLTVANFVLMNKRYQACWGTLVLAVLPVGMLMCGSKRSPSLMGKFESEFESLFLERLALFLAPPSRHLRKDVCTSLFRKHHHLTFSLPFAVFFFFTVLFSEAFSYTSTYTTYASILVDPCVDRTSQTMPLSCTGDLSSLIETSRLRCLHHPFSKPLYRLTLYLRSDSPASCRHSLYFLQTLHMTET